MSAPLLFITGASSGIGQAMALEWARRGGRLALVARRGDEMRAWIAAQGWPAGRAAVYVADARDVAAMTAAGRDCIAAQGLPDVVIANAGISIGVDMSVEADIDVFRRVIETNNIGMAATFQPFIAPMRERGAGRLVGIASVAGIRGLPGHAAYSLSKAGLHWLTTTLAQALGPDIRVNAVGPGPTLRNARQSEEDFARQRDATILKRGAEPDDVAKAVRYLLEADAVTGQMLAVDGGQHLIWQTPDVRVGE